MVDFVESAFRISNDTDDVFIAGSVGEQPSRQRVVASAVKSPPRQKTRLDTWNCGDLHGVGYGYGYAGYGGNHFHLNEEPNLPRSLTTYEMLTDMQREEIIRSFHAMSQKDMTLLSVVSTEDLAEQNALLAGLEQSLDLFPGVKISAEVEDDSDVTII
ncbi:hypothetical protein N7495_001465 [Penicillium taxi]|uniref:uncharacterized protein n=1 Tax=Penicillium taxi TaxID=168475 RepID=UPI0025451231|nr:uncharacterized protein N7495_001465 [Penicillium taxi]KAJ5908783.1 hypothetical protein N7495_001465 [Penicillium taxi]